MKIPYPQSCERLKCPHRQNGECILQNTRDRHGILLSCDRARERMKLEDGRAVITHGDKIRAMNDEELAFTRTVRLRAGFVMTVDAGTFTTFEEAYAAELAWLRQEAT